MRRIPSGSPSCELIRTGRATKALIFAALLVMVGCAPSGPVPPNGADASSTVMAGPARSAPAPATPAFPTAAGTPAFQWVVSSRLQLRLALPDRPGWLMRRERSSFLSFDHAASSSLLELALLRGETTMSRESCEERARLLRDLPKRGQLLSEGTLDVPRGFNTRFEVGIASAAPGNVRGYLLAFGAQLRRCFVLAYETRASGPHAEQQVGDRLAVMQGLTLERLELKSELPGR